MNEGAPALNGVHFTAPLEMLYARTMGLPINQ
jgi:hypothetical protein